METVTVLGKFVYPRKPQCLTYVSTFWQKPKKEVPKLYERILDYLVPFLVEKDDGTLLKKLETMKTTSCYNHCKKRLIENYYIYIAAFYCNEEPLVDLPQPFREPDSEGNNCDEISGLFFTPSGSHLLAASSKACLWNIAEFPRKQPTCTLFEGDISPGMTGLFINEDTLIAFAATNGIVFCWDVRGGKLIRAIKLPLIEGKYSFLGACFSPNGRYLAATVKKAIWLYKIDNILNSSQDQLSGEYTIEPPTMLVNFKPYQPHTQGFRVFVGDNTRERSRILNVQFNEDNTRLLVDTNSDIHFAGNIDMSSEDYIFSVINVIFGKTLFCPHPEYILLIHDDLLLHNLKEKEHKPIFSIPVWDLNNLMTKDPLYSACMCPHTGVIALSTTVEPLETDPPRIYEENPYILLFDCAKKIVVPLCRRKADIMVFTDDGTMLCIAYSAGNNENKRPSIIPVFDKTQTLTDLVRAIRTMLQLKS